MEENKILHTAVGIWAGEPLEELTDAELHLVSGGGGTEICTTEPDGTKTCEKD